MNPRSLCRFGFARSFFFGIATHSPDRLFVTGFLRHNKVLFENIWCRSYIKQHPTMNKDNSKKSGKSHATRASVVDEELRAEREKFTTMPIEKKRKLYKCGEKGYTTLQDIVTWPDYEHSGAQASSPKKSQASPSKSLKKGKPFSAFKHTPVAFDENLNKKISLFRGDITSLEIDAIVNAANNSLLGGGGVDGAIHNSAGNFLKRECSTLKGCDTGDAKITCGYKLPAKHVIHTVGPIGEIPKQLQSAYRRSLEVLKENHLKSVAFPCISTGIYGYPGHSAAHVALETIRQWLETDEYSEQVERIILCVFLKKDVEIYEELLHHYFPLTPGGKKAVTEENSTTDTSTTSENSSADGNDTDVKKPDKKEEESTDALKEESMESETTETEDKQETRGHQENGKGKSDERESDVTDEKDAGQKVKESGDGSPPTK